MNTVITLLIVVLCGNIIKYVCGFRGNSHKLRKTKIHDGSNSINNIDDDNRNKISKTFESHFDSETFAFNEFDKNTTMYTIISSGSLSGVKELLVELKRHNKNYVFVDVKYFTDAEFIKFIMTVLPSYVSDANNESLLQPNLGKKIQSNLNNNINVLRNSTFVFEDEYTYVGGMFEMYERLCQDDKNIFDNTNSFIIKESGDNLENFTIM